MTKPWPTLDVVAVWDVDLAELSGLVFDPVHERVLAVGDRSSLLLTAPWLGDRPGAWSSVDLAAVGIPAKDSQLEAVGIGPDGSVVVATEEPASLFFLDEDGGCRRRIDLDDVEGAGDLVGGNASIEGLAATDRGGLLVAREKRPVRLAELDVADDVRVVGRWSLGAETTRALTDVSDLEHSPVGTWLLSEETGVVALVPSLPPPGDALEAPLLARLPDLDGKPEGLAYLPDGRLLVGLDRKKARRNLVLLEGPSW